MLVYSVLAYGATQPWSQGPLIIAVALAAVFWALRLAVFHEVQVVFSPLGAPLLMIGIYAIVRYVLAEVEPISRSNMLLALTAVLFFFIVLNDIRHRWQVTVIVWVLTGLGVVLTAYGLWQVLRGGQWVLGQPQFAAYRGQASGTFFRPADLAVFLHLTLAVAGANFLLSRRSHNAKTALAFACLIMSGGLYLTFTPLLWLGWLVLLFVLGGFVIRKRGWHFRWVVAGTCSLALVVIAVLYASRSLQTPSQTTEPSLRALCASALAIGQRNFWMGSGAGMFPWLYPAQRTTQGLVDHCPNQYFQVFAEYGAVGSLLLLWLIGAFLVSVAQIVRLRDTKYSTHRLSNRYAFAVAGLAAMAALVVNGAINLNLQSGGILFPLLTIMATTLTCGVHRRIGESEQKHHPGSYAALRIHGISRFVLVAALAGLVALIGTRFQSDYPAELLLRRGQAAFDRFDWNGAERNFLRAWKFDNRSFATAEALGDLYLARATWNERERDALGKQAFSWYYRVKTLNPYHTESLLKTARLHDLLGNRDAARDAYRDALNRDKRNASYHVHLALHYLRGGDQAQAERLFHIARQLEAAEILPTDEVPANRRATTPASPAPTESTRAAR
ncbi:MAG: hypothetical protein PCFJNLEI_00440 [Verrucomicrobiae bacterium]|nr:hypothetical protein [Verrucomicrobiae bacterium]